MLMVIQHFTSLFWISTGVTILLSLTVFLNLVAESMPTTSDAVPLIGIHPFLFSPAPCYHIMTTTSCPKEHSLFNTLFAITVSSRVLCVYVCTYECLC